MIFCTGFCLRNFLLLETAATSKAVKFSYCVTKSSERAIAVALASTVSVPKYEDVRAAPSSGVRSETRAEDPFRRVVSCSSVSEPSALGDAIGGNSYRRKSMISRSVKFTRNCHATYSQAYPLASLTPGSSLLSSFAAKCAFNARRADTMAGWWHVSARYEVNGAKTRARGSTRSSSKVCGTVMASVT
jgi:hypothetical protein